MLVDNLTGLYIGPVIVHIVVRLQRKLGATVYGDRMVTEWRPENDDLIFYMAQNIVCIWSQLPSLCYKKMDGREDLTFPFCLVQRPHPPITD